jgi:hypothetical protein
MPGPQHEEARQPQSSTPAPGTSGTSVQARRRQASAAQSPATIGRM